MRSTYSKLLVDRTRARLEEAGLLPRAELFCASHARMAEFVHEPVDAVVFNLGWLPGGDKSVTTLLDSTLEAVNAALELMKRGGLMTIWRGYPGHAEGGARERDAPIHWGGGAGRAQVSGDGQAVRESAGQHAGADCCREDTLVA